MPVAVITGAAGGIGAELCKIVLHNGIDCCVLDRDLPRARNLATSLAAQAPGRKVDAFAVDLADRDDIGRVCAEILERHPTISYLFNNAGVLTDTLQFSKYGIELNFEVNALAPLAMIDGLRAGLARAQGASIVNTTAGISLREKTLDWQQLTKPATFSKLFGPYTRSKQALNVLTAALAPELGRDGIIIRAADPGPTRSRLTKGAGTPLWMRLFYPLLPGPDKSARKIFDASRGDAYGARSGIVVSGSVKPLPGELATAVNQTEFLARCRALVAAR